MGEGHDPQSGRANKPLQHKKLHRRLIKIQKILAHLYEEAHKLQLQKNRAKGSQARFSSRAHEKRDILLSPKPRRYAIPCSPERKGNTRVAPMVQTPRHQHHVGFDGKWLG